MKLLILFFLVLFVGCGFAVDPALGTEPSSISPDDLDFFERKVRPTLEQHCLECHGRDAKKIRGGLDLSSRNGVLLGGESGTLLNSEQPESGLLWQAVHFEGLEMPPTGKLDEPAIAVIDEWIRRGLPDPRETRAVAAARSRIDVEQGRQFWSFRERTHSQTPKPHHSEWSRSWVDDFLLTSMESAKITPNRDASRDVLIRRIYITLIGLSPTLEERKRFVLDPGSDDRAIANLVDRLLASPHFGQRWGKHWLDVARFAESSGGGRSLMFRNAWRYRDYVVSAMNCDKPFSEFITEQIAGDLLDCKDDVQRREHLVATGFLVLGPTNYEMQDKETLRLDVMDEQVDTIGRALLGMTLGCARCHDHPFNPIPTEDYYALAGIFSSTQTLTPGNVSGFVTEMLPAIDAELDAEERYSRQLAALNLKLAEANKQLNALGMTHLVAKTTNQSDRSVTPSSLAGIVIDDGDAQVTGTWTESTSVGSYVGGYYLHDSGKDKGEKRVCFAHEMNQGGEYEVRIAYSSAENRSSRVPVVVEHAGGMDQVHVNQRQRPSIDGLFESLGSFSFEAGAEARVTIETRGTENVVVADAVQFIGKEAATAGVPSIDRIAASNSNGNSAASIQAQELVDLIQQTQKQIERHKQASPSVNRFAMTVKEESHPADMAIRIRGEARNLGAIVPRGFLRVMLPEGQSSPRIGTGESGRLQLARWITEPSNPLTARVYVNRIWQHVFGVGLVETPDDFGVSGSQPTHPELLDRLAIELIESGWSTKQLVRLLMTSRAFRLSSELTPESVQLDPSNQMCWRAHRRCIEAEVFRDSVLAISGHLDDRTGGNTIESFSQYDWDYDFTGMNRRTIDVPLFRNSMLELVETFDGPNTNVVTGRRSTSNVPTQSLFLMNHPFMQEHASALAQRLLRDAPEGNEDRLQWLYEVTLSRAPTKQERELLLERLQQGDGSHEASLQTWKQICHSLIASVDFRYLE
jgi:hypothetical protein